MYLCLATCHRTRDIGDPHAQSAAEWSGGDDGVTMPPEHGTIGDPNRR